MTALRARCAWYHVARSSGHWMLDDMVRWRQAAADMMRAIREARVVAAEMDAEEAADAAE